MHGIVGITGSPGTGKKSVSPLVGRRLNLPTVSINERGGAYGLHPGAGGEVDTRQLRKLMASDIDGPAVVFGHLLPYVVRPSAVERVVVLRCEPSALRDRLAARGYPMKKVTENVEAELIGVVSADAFKAFGESLTVEVDTTESTPSKAADAVVRAFKSRKRPPRIDWTTGYDSGEKLRSLLGRPA